MNADEQSLKYFLKYYSQRDGTHKNGNLEVLSTISNEFSDQLKLLLTRLGIHYSSYIQIQNRKDCHRHPINRIYIQNNRPIILPECEKNSILDISFAGIEQVYDLTVTDTHNFILSESNIIAHNCDGKATVFKALSLAAGIPDYKVKVCAGWVIKPGSKTAKVGHAYPIYLWKDNWYVIDPTYYPDYTPFEKRKIHKDLPNYYPVEHPIWWSFSKTFCFAQKDLIISSDNN